MNTAAEVDSIARFWRQQADAGTITKSEAGWKIVCACEGWPYTYGAWGAECTPAERKKRYGYTANENIIRKCQVLNGDRGTCTGCKWFPEGQRTRTFDCRGLTDWTLKWLDFDLYGDMVSTQWNHGPNWCRKGKIGTDPLPEGVLVNLFIYKNGKWTHTGFYYNGETCECSAGVQHFQQIQTSRWTHWAVAACFEGELKEDNMPKEGTAIVTGKKVALREEASTRAKVITRINTGETVNLEEDPHKWDYVEYNGKRGYMMKEFLQEGGK